MARGQMADYAILPMNTFADEELQAKQLVSNSPFLKENYVTVDNQTKIVIFLFMYQLIVTCGYSAGVGGAVI